MIFNMVGAAGKKPFIPQFTGKAKLVLLNGGKAGYMEFYTSGTLTWLDDKVPPSVDLFCVGGGAGGAHGVYYSTDSVYYAGGGGGSGYTSTVHGAVLPASLEINIGAGGLAGTPAGAGGTTSIGALCTAAGGNPPTTAKNLQGYPVGGSGGSAGGNGGRGYANEVTSLCRGGNGGTNGGPPSNINTAVTSTSGTSQGSPTTDLLGRVHAGGGGGGRGWYKYGTTTKGPAGVGGASDFIEGSGQPPYNLEASTPGGGYGGGGAGGDSTSSPYNGGGAGGQGFAMIAWGDYSSAMVNEGGSHESSSY